jgi:hypothetical protein
MKFEKAEPEFSPIVITLETEMEAQALRAVLANVIGHKVDGDFLFKLYEKLDNQFPHSERMFKVEGTAHLRKI